MRKLNIALVAHDARKQELVDWPGKGDYYNTYLAVTPVLSGPH